MHTTLRSGVCPVVILVLLAVPAAQTRPGDYTQWRGQNRDGSASSFTEPKTWPETLTQRWKVDVGLGYATPLVVGDRVFVFSRQGGDEVMSALDAASGKVLWHTGYSTSFTMNRAAARHNEGPKSTPVYSDGKLFSIGMTGHVTAFDARSGRQLWQKPGSELVPLYTTHSFSPIADRGMVIFHVGGHNQGALTAFDANTGAVRWSWNGDGPGYGSPIIVELSGVRQLVTITQAKLIGIDLATGALLWEHPFVSSNFTNSITPLLHRQTLMMSNGGPMVGVSVMKRDNKWIAENAWENSEVPYRFSNPVLVGDAVFGLSTRNSGQYFGVDANTGKTLWTSEGRQAGNAALVKAGTQTNAVLFSLEDDGELVVWRSSRTGFEPMKRYKVAESDTWTQPAISGNRVFVKDLSTLALWTVN